MIRLSESAYGPCDACGASTATTTMRGSGVILALDRKDDEVTLCQRCAVETSMLILHWLRSTGRRTVVQQALQDGVA